MKPLYLLILFTLSFFQGYSQEDHHDEDDHGVQVEGRVYELLDNKKDYLIGAAVKANLSGAVTLTDEKGKFHFHIEQLPDTLTISYIGYETKVIVLNEVPSKPLSVELKVGVGLSTVEVVGRENATKISTTSLINTESLNSRELKKAACCNLSESFETNASVDVVFSDAVSGTKKIQMLGLDGVYTQIMFEGIPNLRGLSSAYGLTHIPGKWVNAIQITKGSGSVANGFESITGQINLDYMKPIHDAPLVFGNIYGNHNGRMDADLQTNLEINEKWGTGIYLNTQILKVRNDNNYDGFMDMPLNQQLNLLNRWNYETDKICAQFGVRVLDEEKLGGQLDFQNFSDILDGRAFGLKVNTNQYEFFSKTGFKMPAKPDKSLGLIVNAKRHDQKSFFGSTIYDAKHDQFYFNSIYEGAFRNPFHTYRTGVSYQYDDYQEALNDSTFNRIESVPGAFFEYTINEEDKFSVVAGIRGDYHNKFGLFFSPRVHFKYVIKPKLTTFRMSAGRGYRTANIYAENTNAFLSSRNLIVTESLDQEKAWNFGTSLTHKILLFNNPFTINLDYYYTFFDNQVIVDYDTDVNSVFFSNLNGQSFSHSAQTDVTYELTEQLELKLSYKRYEVKTTYNGKLLDKPLVPKNRLLAGISYTSKDEKWEYELSANWFGKKRISNTSGNPENFQLPEYSDPFVLMMTQIRRNFKKFNVYLGVENLLNFKQPNPIIAANDPFGPYFDGSMIWGPLNGRMFYGGLSFKINKNH